jgi:hypothetical protein
MPKTITYVCIWEICIGHVKTMFSAEEAALLVAAGKAFRTNFTDVLNAPADEFAIQEFPDRTLVAC